jgi:hypothetical protein
MVELWVAGGGGPHVGGARRCVGNFTTGHLLNGVELDPPSVVDFCEGSVHLCVCGPVVVGSALGPNVKRTCWPLSYINIYTDCRKLFFC